MTAAELRELIAAIEEEKRVAGIVPAHVLRIADLMPRVDITSMELLKLLSELHKAKKIRAGHTINDIWIETT